MEQGNRLDSTLMSARHEVDVRFVDESAQEDAVTRLLQQPPKGSPQSERVGDASQGISPNMPALEDAGIPARDAGRALAARVVEYFGNDPLDPDLDCDFRLRTMAQALLDGRSATAPDPIFAAIAETRRLTWARDRATALPQPAGSIDPLPEQDAASEAFFAHVDGVLLKTVPTTAVGCAAFARYAGEFLADEGFSLDEDQANEQHVRILNLIARSPLLDGAPVAPPPVPDFSECSAQDLYRTYNAFKLATDVMGLTGWTISEEGVGNRLLDAENDRLSWFQGYLADEMKRRDLPNRTEAGWRADTVINRAIACGDYEEAARFATEADARRL